MIVILNARESMLQIFLPVIGTNKNSKCLWRWLVAFEYAKPHPLLKSLQIHQYLSASLFARFKEILCNSQKATESVFSHTLTGSSSQISRAYSEMVRSLENLPIRAVLRIAISAHLALSLKTTSTLSWASL